MHRYSRLRLEKKVLRLIASFMVVGCTQTATGMDVPLPVLETVLPEGALTSSQSLIGPAVAPSEVAPSAVAPTIAATISAEKIGDAEQIDDAEKIGDAEKIDFEICSESPSWMRLAELDQLKQLREIPRYGAAIEEEPLKSMVQDFWTHEAISFTTYGLSARIEPLYFSGLWTIVDTLSTCYEGSRAEDINAGRRAEVWLINHQVNHIQWDGNSYIMNVQPTGGGVQLIQFPRQETQTPLPLTIVNEDEIEIAVLSGDWQ